MSIEAKLLIPIKTMAKSSIRSIRSIRSISIICPLLIISTEIREVPAHTNRQLLLSPGLELPQPLMILYSLDLSMFTITCISSRMAL